MWMKDFKKLNKGMTLVELLVAMAIFAAAIVPILYAFVYSTGFNYKSQQTLQATGIAQAIIEKCKAANINYDSLVDDLTSGDILNENNSFNVSAPDVSGNTYIFRGVKAQNFERHDTSDAVDSGNSNRRTYDVVVTLSPQGDSITDFSIAHPMRSGVTANYTLDALRVQDQAAKEAIFNRLKDAIRNNITCTPTGLSSSQIEAYADSLFIDSLDIKNLYIERRIKITSDDSGVVVSVGYYYDGYGDDVTHPVNFSETHSANVGGTTYTFSVNANVSTDPDFTDPSDQCHYTYDAFGLSDKASSIFFYYYPVYGATNGRDNTANTHDDTPNYRDHFIIENNMTSSFAVGGNPSDRLDIYLFKQMISSDPANTDSPYIFSNIDDLEDGGKYKCEIELSNNSSFPTNLYHNLLWNSESGDLLAGANQPTVNCGSNCYNRTTCIYYDASHSIRQPSGDAVSDYYSDFFYDIEGSEIIADKTVFPYWNEKVNGVTSVNYYSARYTITVEVYPHNASGTINSSDLIASITSDFLNW